MQISFSLPETQFVTDSPEEATRKIRENAVRIEGEVVVDLQKAFGPGFEGVLQVGKRNFARVKLVMP